MLTPQRGSYYNRKYGRVVWAAGYTDMDYARNQEQALLALEGQNLGSSIWNNGVVGGGLQRTISGNTVTFTDGTIVTGGRVYQVGGQSVTFSPLDDQCVVIARITVSQIDSTLDPTLVDPNTGDPVQDRLEADVQLIGARLVAGNWPGIIGGDVINEGWGAWLDARDMHTTCGVNLPGRPMVPVSSSGFGPYTIVSGDPLAFRMAEEATRDTYGMGRGNGMQLLHTHGVETALSVTPSLQPNTLYYVYLDLRTKYGQPDLTPDANGFFVSINRAATGGPVSGGMTNYCGTLGGDTLLGGFNRTTFTFTSDGSASPVTITLGIPANAPTTQIYVSYFLVTALPLAPNAQTRRDLFMFGTSQMTLWQQPRTTLPEMTVDTIYTQKRYLIGDKFGITYPYYYWYQITSTLVITGNPIDDSVMRIPAYTGQGPQTWLLDISKAGPVINGRDQALPFTPWDGHGNGLIDVFMVSASNQIGYPAAPGLMASTRGKIKGPIMPFPYNHYAYLCTLIVDQNGHLYQTTVRNNHAWLQGPDNPYRILLASSYSNTPAPVVGGVYVLPQQCMEFTAQGEININNDTGAVQSGFIDIMTSPYATPNGEFGYVKSFAFWVPSTATTANGGFMVLFDARIPNVPTPAAAYNSFYYQFRWNGAGITAPGAATIRFRLLDFTMDNGAI